MNADVPTSKTIGHRDDGVPKVMGLVPSGGRVPPKLCEFRTELTVCICDEIRFCDHLDIIERRGPSFAQDPYRPSGAVEAPALGNVENLRQSRIFMTAQRRIGHMVDNDPSFFGVIADTAQRVFGKLPGPRGRLNEFFRRHLLRPILPPRCVPAQSANAGPACAPRWFRRGGGGGCRQAPHGNANPGESARRWQAP
jgi:hypothetical protein